jgi:hypothetical protein
LHEFVVSLLMSVKALPEQVQAMNLPEEKSFCGRICGGKTDDELVAQWRERPCSL